MRNPYITISKIELLCFVLHNDIVHTGKVGVYLEGGVWNSMKYVFRYFMCVDIAFNVYNLCPFTISL